MPTAMATAAVVVAVMVTVTAMVTATAAVTTTERGSAKVARGKQATGKAKSRSSGMQHNNQWKIFLGESPYLARVLVF
jgi:hypothetical protein